MEPYDSAVYVIRALREAGHEALLAGGCVRDRLLGEPPKDFDVATSAEPAEVQRLFERTEPVGAQFGVVLVLVGGNAIEVATFRSDGDYHDGRHPSWVRFSTPREDALRRDFTINALFLEPDSGRVIDFVGGREDLAARRLRTVGNAEARFREDRLRMLRAVRFAARFELAVDPPVRAACRRMAPCIRGVARERITDELTRIAVGPAPDRALALLQDFGLLPWVLPGVAADGPGLSTLRRLPSPRSVPLGLAGFLRRVSGPARERVLGGLRLSGADRKAVGAILDIASRLRRFRELDVAGQKRLVRRPEFADAIALELAADPADGVAALEAARVARTSWSETDLHPSRHLDGSDLIALGVPAGPEIGRLLRLLEDEALRGRVKSREDAMRVVLRGRRGEEGGEEGMRDEG